MSKQVVYAKLSKGSPCQHIAENNGTLCNTKAIAEHRLDKWEFSKHRGKWFDDRRICFNCLKLLMKNVDPMDSMMLAESFYLGRRAKLRVVS